jgi:hypothetical protein
MVFIEQIGTLLFPLFIQCGMSKSSQTTSHSAQTDGDKHIFRQTEDGAESAQSAANENASYDTISKAHMRPLQILHLKRLPGDKGYRQGDWQAHTPHIITINSPKELFQPFRNKRLRHLCISAPDRRGRCSVFGQDHAAKRAADSLWS